MYLPANDIKEHFRHDPFKAMVAPRPIGWISTRGADGRDNLAPYSFFNAISSRPPMLMFISSGRKDSLINCETQGEFAFNLVSQSMMSAMSRTGVDVLEDEFELAGVEKAECRAINCPRVALSPASMECVVTQILPIRDKDGADTACTMVMGQVIGLHVQPELVTGDGLFDTAGADLVARCGYRDYAVNSDLIELSRGG